MRKLLGLTLLLALVACSQDRTSPTAPLAAGPTITSSEALTLSADGQYVAGRLLIRFRSGALVDDLLVPHLAVVEREVIQGVKLLKVTPGNELAIAAALRSSPWVEFVEPDYIRTYGVPCESPDTDCTLPTDTYFGYRWDLHNDGTTNDGTGAHVANTGVAGADIDWLEAFDQLGAFTGTARVAIIDTGILASHVDLSGRVVGGFDFFSNDADATDEDGHGTHVAGLVAANGNNGIGVDGIAWGPNIQLLAVRVCGPGGCPSSDIADGIEWAVDNGANVINLSLGGPVGAAVEQIALQYARANNVLPFCAAGNDAGPVSFPAQFPECVAVSATDWSDGLASYSNFGPDVELSAPGGDSEIGPSSFILSTHGYSRPPKKGGGPPVTVMNYAFFAGTSMATPEAAGLAALLHALGTTGDDEKLQIMKDTADDLGVPGTDPIFGAGRINVFAAINGEEPPPPGDIVLTATKRAGKKKIVDLAWTGAVGPNVEVYQNNVLLLSTPNDGVHAVTLANNATGTFTYKVCETGGVVCSNNAGVTY